MSNTVYIYIYFLSLLLLIMSEWMIVGFVLDYSVSNEGCYFAVGVGAEQAHK